MIVNPIKKLSFLAALTTVLFVQEMFLTSIPNVQLTVLLLILYTKTVGVKETLIILFIHVILDTFIFGGGIYYSPFMLLGWSMIPILLGTIFKNVNKDIYLALLSILFSVLYSWAFIIPSVLIFDVPFWLYLYYDIPWEIMLSVSSFISVLLLYSPLFNLINLFKDRLY